jgi:hypothetical protein
MGLGAAWDRKLMRSAGIVTRWALVATHCCVLLLTVCSLLSAVCDLTATRVAPCTIWVGAVVLGCPCERWFLIAAAWRVQGCSRTLV